MKYTGLLPFILILLLIVPEIALGQEVVNTSSKSKILEYLKDLDWVNISLFLVSVLIGGFWYKGRTKLRLIGELFLKAYEYTDDKRLSEEERRDLVRRFVEIIRRGPILPPIKLPIPTPAPSPTPSPTPSLEKKVVRRNRRKDNNN